MILISACLGGARCKYDGGHNAHPVAEALLREGRAIAVCPEKLGGLKIPRPAAEIAGGDGGAVLDNAAQVYDAAGKLITPAFITGAEQSLKIAQQNQVKFAIMKNRSPSCGVEQIYDGSFTGKVIGGCGVTTALLRRNGIRVFSEESDERALAEALRSDAPTRAAEQ